MPRPRPAALAPASAGLALLLTLTGCGLLPFAGTDKEERRVIEVGAVVEGRAVIPEVSEGIEVRLPSGPAFFDVDDDLRAIPDDEIPGELEDVPAAADARLVRVSWGREFLGYGSDLMRLMTGSDSEDVGEQVDLALTADGRRIDVPGIGRLEGIGDPDHVFVAVPRDAGELGLEVTYDGVTQHVDLAAGEVEPGRAAGLYDVPVAADRHLGDGGAECPFVGRRGDGLEPSFACGVLDSWQVPYVDGLGWAPAGRTWFVADASSRLMSLWWIAGDDATEYRTALRSWQVRADGVLASATLPRRLGNRAEDKRLVFAVEPGPRHRVAFRAVYAGRAAGDRAPGAPGAPERVTVRMARSVQVPGDDTDR